MPDPAKTVAATVRYEIRIVSAPYAFDFQSQTITLAAGEDLVVLARMTMMGARIMEEAIVGIVGSKFRGDPREFLALRSFLASGGVIGLNKELL
jgi:hypothetical protein